MPTCKLAATAAQNAIDAGIDTSVAPSGFLAILEAIISAIFPALAPILAPCIPAQTPAHVRNFVTNRYNRRKARYAPGILNRAAVATENASTAQNVTFNAADTETITVSYLDAIRNGSDSDIQEALDIAS